MTLMLLAQGTNSPTGPEFGKASPLGLVIVLVLLAGTILLIRNMNKHIKNLPAEFSPEHPEPDQEADEGTEHGIAAQDVEAADEAKPEAANGNA
ncbi:hypothetical protein [Nocardia seriolae]|uniref:Membrane protein n=1 Tax=Nocardia seriolae TaxID=37332 RepID=A0A0B8NEY5_9NOCA|nr:hypothetical protein [Nocardia seriolae]APA95843.1 hypothetical protein NS506_01775 [Nocardia seriolae]MTJ66049.1 hypothetical protein [Nocardia seriolae]MTJ76015.1 hypothetical protein [Nocardia seriolae]MTJ86031.1 hypothetical protein [Nocardia seriolae]MTK30026.1 hypothetical protein [Nocardia seriolae]